MKEKLAVLVAEAEQVLEDVTPNLEYCGYDETSGEMLENALTDLINGVKDILEEND